MLIGEGSILGWFLGDDPSQGGTPELQWGMLPESWGVFVLIAAVLAAVFFVVWLYVKENKTCPFGARVFLAVLRSVVVLLIIVFLLQPYIVRKRTRTLKPTIGFGRDTSRSMDRFDKYTDGEQAKRIAKATGWKIDDIKNGKYKRSDIFQHAFNRKDGELVADLRDKGSIRIIDFADSLNDVTTLPATGEDIELPGQTKKSDDGDKDPADKKGKSEDVAKTDESGPKEIENKMPVLLAEGRGTDIWQVLRELLNENSRLSAIVLATDGQHNGSGDPIELAKKAAELEIPIFIIPFGDPKPPVNLSVNSLAVRSPVRPQEPFEIEALIYANRVDLPKVRVELVQYSVNEANDQLEDEEVVDEKEIDVPATGNLMRVGFQYVAKNTGKYVFGVRVQTLDNETETDDNEKRTEVIDVVDQKVKVLLIAGAPTWEYRMVQRLLQRDKSISISCWLQTMDEDRPQEGNEPISVLPRGIKELGKYNVIMMFDPNPNEFDNEWISDLRQFIRRKAGGFLYMTGPKYTTEFITLNRLDIIRQILPVRFGDGDVLESSQILMSDISRPGKMLPVDFNLDHAVMKFDADPAVNRARWADMPSIYWSYPTLAAKPTAKVLLERGDQVGTEGNQPLLVVGRYGAGNVLYMGFNGTWRWRRVGVQAQFFDRFWIQICRFLIETRSLQGDSRGVIDPDRTDYEIGDKVTLTARILNEQFEPLDAQSVKAQIRGEDGRVRDIELKQLPQQTGTFEASFIAQQTGGFTVNVDLGSEEDEGVIKDTKYRVDPPRIESNNYWLNESLLEQIAKESKGKVIQMDELDKLADLLPDMNTTTEINTPPIPLWDIETSLFGRKTPLRYFIFGILVFLLTLEWSIRKKTKLL